MKHAYFVEQNNRNATALPLADLSIELLEESQNVSPGDAAADGSAKNQLESALMPAFHRLMVLLFSAVEQARPPEPDPPTGRIGASKQFSYDSGL